MTTTTETTAADAAKLLAMLAAGPARRRDIQQTTHWTKERLDRAIAAAVPEVRPYDLPSASVQWLDLTCNAGVADDTDPSNTGVAEGDAERFAALARLQPKLAVIAERCAIGRDPRALLVRDVTYTPPTAFCRRWFWNRKVQGLLPDLVGGEARGFRGQLGDLLLESSYDLVVDHLHALLPPCSHAGAPCGH